jgi:sugar lactone lactonase YvrE
MLIMRIRLYNKNIIVVLVLLIISLNTAVVCFADDELNIVPNFNSYLTKTVVNEKTFNLGGQLSAIASDTYGNLYVAKDGKEIVKISFSGKVKPIYKLDSNYLSQETKICSLKLAKDGTIYVAATDCLFKIAPDGQVKMLINDPDVKPVGVELDRNGNLYVISKMKVFKYNPALEKSLFVDCGGVNGSLGLTDLKFDAKAKNLYIANGRAKQVYKYPVQKDGRAGKQQIIVDLNELAAQINPFNSTALGKVNPSWLATDDFGVLYVSLENTSSILGIGTDGSYTLYKINPIFSNTAISNHIGNKGFYITSNDGKVHRINPIDEDDSDD